jgi:hypothetical protein
MHSGKTFGNLFSFFKNNATAKPLFITEYGIDAYDNDAQAEDQTVHSEYLVALWTEIAANTDSCSGGCAFSYTDEWYVSKCQSVIC